MEGDKFIGKKFLNGDDIVYVRSYNNFWGTYRCDITLPSEDIWTVNYTLDYLDSMTCISDSTVLEAIYGEE